MINKIEKFLQIGNAIRNGTDFIVIAHTNPDGDAIASVLAFGLMLKELNKKFKMVLPDEIPKEYNFLPGAADIEITRELPDDIETLIILDCGAIKRIKFFKEPLERAKIVVNIDHHYSNSGYGDFSYIDDLASSVTEILFELFEYHKYPITREIAMCLYTGILTDTGSFKQENATAKCHFVVSRLLQFPIKPNKIYSQIYEQFSINQFKILQKGFQNLELYFDDSLAMMYFDLDMYKETNTKYCDLAEFINFIRLLKNIKIAIICKQLNSGEFRISLRSKSDIDVSQIAIRFDGGGHPQAAACTIGGEIEEVKALLLETIGEFLP